MADPTDKKSPARRRGRPPRVSREDVIDAAVELFARRGYAGTSLVAIASAIGVTDVALLHYFENKAAILRAVLDREDEPARLRMSEGLRPGGLQAVRALQEWGAVMQANPLTTSLQIVLGAESLSETSELHGLFADRYRYIIKRITRALQQGVENGEFRADIDMVYEAAAFHAFLDGVRLQWFFTDGGIPMDEYCRTYVEQLIERLSVPQASTLDSRRLVKEPRRRKAAG